MPRACLLVLLMVSFAVAAPVPKADPELERIGKVFGTVVEPVGCKPRMDDKNVLTVGLEAVKPGVGKAAPTPNGIAFERPTKGDFTATVRLQLKTDLAAMAEPAGTVTVGWALSHKGGTASVEQTFGTGPVIGKPGQLTTVSHTTARAGNLFGQETKASSPRPHRLTAMELRLRVAGKETITEVKLVPDGEWQPFHTATAPAGEGKLTLRVRHTCPADVTVVLDQFEVK